MVFYNTLTTKCYEYGYELSMSNSIGQKKQQTVSDQSSCCKFRFSIFLGLKLCGSNVNCHKTCHKI